MDYCLVSWALWALWYAIGIWVLAWQRFVDGAAHERVDDVLSIPIFGLALTLIFWPIAWGLIAFREA
jgi:hypothetical protein